MRRVNVLWPEKLESEYLRLCDEFYDTITDEEAEDDTLLFAKKDEFIKAHGTQELQEWISCIDR